MGKWAARLAEKTAAPPYAGTDETAKRGLSSVLAVTPEGGARDFHAAPEAPDLAAVAWTDADIAAFLARRARLMRWGWAELDAERLAERMHLRDVQGDDRVLCVECQHLTGRAGAWGCGKHRAAGVGRELPGELVTLPQRCPAARTQR